MTALTKRLILAVHRYCVNECRRARCLGCVFEKWSERNRQIARFVLRRERIAAARRLASGMAG